MTTESFQLSFSILLQRLLLPKKFPLFGWTGLDFRSHPGLWFVRVQRSRNLRISIHETDPCIIAGQLYSSIAPYNVAKRAPTRRACARYKVRLRRQRQLLDANYSTQQQCDTPHTQSHTVRYAAAVGDSATRIITSASPRTVYESARACRPRSATSRFVCPRAFSRASRSSDTRACAVRFFLPTPLPTPVGGGARRANLTVKTLVVLCRLNWLRRRRCRRRRGLQTSLGLERQRVEPNAAWWRSATRQQVPERWPLGEAATSQRPAVSMPGRRSRAN